MSSNLSFILIPSYEHVLYSFWVFYDCFVKYLFWLYDKGRHFFNKSYRFIPYFLIAYMCGPTYFQK